MLTCSKFHFCTSKYSKNYNGTCKKIFTKTFLKTISVLRKNNHTEYLYQYVLYYYYKRSVLFRCRSVEADNLFTYTWITSTLPTTLIDITPTKRCRHTHSPYTCITQILKYIYYVDIIITYAE